MEAADWKARERVERSETGGTAACDAFPKMGGSAAGGWLFAAAMLATQPAAADGLGGLRAAHFLFMLFVYAGVAILGAAAAAVLVLARQRKRRDLATGEPWRERIASLCLGALPFLLASAYWLSVPEASYATLAIVAGFLVCLAAVLTLLLEGRARVAGFLVAGLAVSLLLLGNERFITFNRYVVIDAPLVSGPAIAPIRDDRFILPPKYGRKLLAVEDGRIFYSRFRSHSIDSGTEVSIETSTGCGADVCYALYRSAAVEHPTRPRALFEPFGQDALARSRGKAVHTIINLPLKRVEINRHYKQKLGDFRLVKDASGEIVWNPLHEMLWDGLGHRDDISELRLLLEKGADPNYAVSGQTSLYKAVAVRNVAAVRALLDAGGNPNLQARADAPPSAMFPALTIGPYETFEELARALVAAGVNLDAADREGATVLHKLARFPGMDAGRKTRFLLTAGANPNLKDKSGRTARDVARAELEKTDARLRQLEGRGEERYARDSLANETIRQQELLAIVDLLDQGARER